MQTDTKLTIRLIVTPVGDFLGRMETILKTLNELAGKARQELVTQQDADINARIAAALDSPIAPAVREVAEHLEPVGA